MPSPLFHVDAFTERPFSGNPAAVCVLAEDPGADWMAAVAAEINLSETAFLRRRGEAWDLRWFTPTVEVDLCGHATLASAHALWEAGLADPKSPLRFESRSGRLVARALDGDGRIALDFPAEPAREIPAPAALLAALRLSAARWTGRNRLDFFVEVESEAAVRALGPDFPALAAATRPERGVIVTARAAAGPHDFVSRYFAPDAGIDEDPVTGSAHCALGPYWCERLGRREVTGYQASRRGGTVGVRWSGGDRVELSGRAVTVSRGELV